LSVTFWLAQVEKGWVPALRRAAPRRATTNLVDLVLEVDSHFLGVAADLGVDLDRRLQQLRLQPGALTESGNDLGGEANQLAGLGVDHLQLELDTDSRIRTSLKG
jgi:hypothetical protein